MADGITVKTRLQTTQIAEDGSVDRQQSESTGKGWFGDAQWVVCFSERTEERESATTTVKVGKNCLTVIRRGYVTMRQVFHPKKETKGLYTHPYGAMEMVTETEHFHRSAGPEGWQVEWSYRLRLNGVEAGTFHMNLTIKPAGTE